MKCTVGMQYTGLLGCLLGDVLLPLSWMQNLVQQRKPLTAADLEAAIDNIRGAVMICYPAGLPEWDFVRQCLEHREDLSGTNVSNLPQDLLSNSSMVHFVKPCRNYCNNLHRIQK